MSNRLFRSFSSWRGKTKRYNKEMQGYKNKMRTWKPSAKLLRLYAIRSKANKQSSARRLRNLTVCLWVRGKNHKCFWTWNTRTIKLSQVWKIRWLSWPSFSNRNKHKLLSSKISYSIFTREGKGSRSKEIVRSSTTRTVPHPLHVTEGHARERPWDHKVLEAKDNPTLKCRRWDNPMLKCRRWDKTSVNVR